MAERDAMDEADALAELLGHRRAADRGPAPEVAADVGPPASRPALIWAGLAASAIWFLLARQLVNRLFAEEVGDDQWSFIAAAVIPDSILLCGLLAIAMLAAKKGGVRIEWLGASPRAAAATGLGLGLAVPLYILAAAAVAGHAIAIDSSGPALGMLVLGSVTILLQVTASEFFFRGWLQHAIGGAASPAIGILASAALFALLGMANEGRGLPATLNLLLAGTCFGLLVRRFGGLLAAISAHFAWSWTNDILIGLIPNPGVGVWGAFFDHDLVGKGAWIGWGEGPNASIAATIMLLALLLPLGVVPARNRTQAAQPA